MWGWYERPVRISLLRPVERILSGQEGNLMGLVDYSLGMDYGIGVDSLSGAIRGDGVVRTEPQDTTGAGGQTVTFDMKKVTTMQEMNSSLGITAEAEGSWGLGSASMKADFGRSCQLNSYSLFLVVRSVVTNSFREMRAVKIGATAADLLTNGKDERFREQFGDTFVQGMLTGGEFYGVLEIRTRDKASQQQVSFDVEASYGTAGASMKFKEAINKVSSKATIQLHLFQRGGDTIQVDAAEELVEKALAFAPTVAGDASVPYQALLQDYRTLDLPAAPNWVDIQNAKEVMRFLIRTRNDLLVRLNDITYVLEHADEFDSFDSEQLREARNNVTKMINLVTDQASKFVDTPAEAKFPEDLQDLGAVDLPARKDGTPGVKAAAIDTNLLRRAVDLKRLHLDAPTKPSLGPTVLPGLQKVKDIDGTERDLTPGESALVTHLGRGATMRLKGRQ